jgi:mRNA-degrading endonuclease RelE of RelBE toxin-antitoxin system
VAKEEVWEVVLTKPAKKVYDKTSKDIRQRLDNCFGDLEQNPLYGTNIKLLTGQLKGLSRYRVGDWRVIYRPLEETRRVEIIAILPRGDAYK